jgi:glycosyltransferase involved in cell wall biosynthesis
LRFAIVSYRYGDDFVGGAETSLRSMAEALHREGHDVEVFTTCTRRESGWTNDYPEQTDHVGGVAVHRFRIDRHDAERHADAVRTLIEEPENLQAQCDLVQHSVRSARLLEALGRRSHSFDAIITGPYGVGLTHAVAQALPDRTLVVPCFHDEPLARLPLWQEAYSWAGGLLYHSAEEQDLAQRRLGINHPRATCCGTFFDSALRGDSERGRALVRGNRPYVVYCGRYSREKELPALLEAARGYHARHPDRFRFVFLGAGGVAIPREPWAHDLGFVDAATKRDVLAGAAALIQLSRCESLSLAALEAWAQGVPVIADRRCPVMAGHWQRSQAGRLVEDAAGLADVLDDLWHQPEPWREQGKRGRSYVAAHYGSRSSFVERLVQAGRALREPIADCMRRRGRERAVLFRRDRWREQFAALVEDVLHAPARPFQELLQIEPRSAERTAAAGAGEVLVPIRITHRGTHAAVHEGPARIVLHSTVAAADGATPNLTGRAIPLPSLLLPGQTLAAAVPVSVPAMPGNYCVSFHAGRADGGSMRNSEPGEAKLRLVVTTAGHHRSEHPCTPMLALIQTALADAERLHRLPADYADVTQGWFAAGKRWLKRKLLGNFKRAYVDVLSRQQSAFNARLLDVLRELAECCATLDHVGRSDTRDRLEASERRCRELEARLQRLQAMVEEPRPSLTASASAPDSSSTSCSGGTGLTRNASTPSCELR